LWHTLFNSSLSQVDRASAPFQLAVSRAAETAGVSLRWNRSPSVNKPKQPGRDTWTAGVNLRWNRLTHAYPLPQPGWVTYLTGIYLLRWRTIHWTTGKFQI
jgi:hypothetical protein